MEIWNCVKDLEIQSVIEDVTEPSQRGQAGHSKLNTFFLHFGPRSALFVRAEPVEVYKVGKVDS